MIRLGLIGKEISHSRSKEMYEKILNQKISYDLLDYPNVESIPPIKQLLTKLNGLSITSPYKKSFQNQIDQVIFNGNSYEKSFPINAVKNDSGRILATNTDYLAIQELFPQLRDQYKISEVILLGNGVMAEVFTNAIEELKFKKPIQYSRSTHKKFPDYENISRYCTKESVLIVNSCSRNFVFRPTEYINCIFWDFNYSFRPHEEHLPVLVNKYIDGLEMLLSQAKHAINFWEIN